MISAAYRITGNEYEAKDAVQNVFLKFFTRRDYLQVNDLKYYLLRAVRNESLNLLQSSNKLRVHHQQFAETVSDVVINDLLEQAENEERIYNKINSLPLKCRQVFTLSRLQEKNNQEIASELGLSIRTVETHISNALRILREKSVR